MKGHFLPQSYLRAFTDPDTPTGHEPYVWICHADEPTTWKKRAPRNIAAEPDYYVTAEAEALLSEMESLTAPVVRKVLRHSDLTDDDQWKLATFVGLMMTRVPAVHENVQRFLSNRERKRLALLHRAFSEDPRRLEAWKERFRRETGRADLDGLSPEHLDPQRYDIEATRSVAIGTAFSPLPDLVGIICRMTWSLLTTESPHYFITSDAPCCMVDPTIPPEIRAVSGNGGLIFPNVEVSLPISPEIAFFAGWQGEESGYKRVPYDIVEHINARTISGAQRLLIAPKRMFPGSNRLTLVPTAPAPSA